MAYFIPLLLVTSVSALGFGAFLGGWAIASGHLLLLIASPLVFISAGSLIDPKRTMAGPAPCSQARSHFRDMPISAWTLASLLIVYLVSIVFAVKDFGEGLHLVKKMRYVVIPILLMVVPVYFRSFYKYRIWCAQFGLLFLGLGIIFASLSGLIGHFTGYNPLLLGAQPYPGRNGGVYSVVMTYAYGLSIALLPFIWLGLDRKLVEKLYPAQVSTIMYWGIWVTIIVGIVGLYFSFTRGAVLGLIAGITTLMLCQKAWKTFAITIGLGVLVLTIAIAQGSRFVTLEQASEKRSTSRGERFAQWETGWGIFRENPIVGVGYRQFEKVSVEYKKSQGMPKDSIRYNAKGEPVHSWLKGHAHNNILEHLASTGIFGGLLFVCFIVAWIKEAVGTIFLPAIVSFVVSGMFENTFFDSEVVTVVMLFYTATQFGNASIPGSSSRSRL